MSVFVEKGQNNSISKCAGPATFGPIFPWSMSIEPPLSPVSRSALKIFENHLSSFGLISACQNFLQITLT
jgi:hypothetical protein